jgi:hypothetical protein
MTLLCLAAGFGAQEEIRSGRGQETSGIYFGGNSIFHYFSLTP